MMLIHTLVASACVFSLMRVGRVPVGQVMWLYYSGNFTSIKCRALVLYENSILKYSLQKKEYWVND